MTSNNGELTPYEQICLHKDKLWYLACAYSGTTKAEIEENVHESMMVAGLLMQDGFHIHHPTYMTHRIAQWYDLPTNYEHWVKYNEFFIDASHGILVVQNKMWDSRGVKYELQYAKSKWKPAFVVLRDRAPGSPRNTPKNKLYVRDLYEAWPELS